MFGVLSTMITMMGQRIESPPPNLSELEAMIFEELRKSRQWHHYQSVKELRFELLLREKIIESALELSKSKAEFSVFETSKFNPLYWIKTPRGYALKPNIPPALAVKDIYTNGQEYSFECSTAIVIIYYNAVLNAINIHAFNQLFQHLLIWDWSYDEDLRIITREGTDFIPGDVVYFHNPDYKYPVWIGENAVMLGNNQYFGHGIGIETKEGMIKALNTLRKDNPTRTAYLLSQYSRLDFKYLSQFA